MGANKNKWFYGALAIAILNPIFGGIIVGLLLVSEPQSRREGVIVTCFALIWGAIVLLLAFKFNGMQIPSL